MIRIEEELSRRRQSPVTTPSEGGNLTFLEQSVWSEIKSKECIEYEAHQQTKQLKIARETNLVRAIKDGKPRAVQLVCALAPEKINAADRHGWISLHHAVQTNAFEMVRMLVNAAANLEAKTNNGNTPLHFAAEYNSPSIAALLLQSGSNIHASNQSGNTALHWAAMGNSCEVATALLQAGASIEVRDDNGYTPLAIAKVYKRKAILDLLVVTREQRITNGALCRLLQAVMSKSWEQWQSTYQEMKRCLQIKNSIVSRIQNRALASAWEKWYSPVRAIGESKAKEQEQMGIMQEQAQRAASDEVDVMAAASSGDLESLKLVGAFEPRRFHVVREHDGHTALHLAAKHGHLEVVQLLVASKCSTNVIDKSRCTPLQWAEGHMHDAVAEFLTSHASS